MIKLVLLRHGESIWNRENRFTGWTDVGLTRRVKRRRARPGGCSAAPASRSISLTRAIKSPLARARGDGPHVDPGRALVAAQRAPPRRAAGLERAEMAAEVGGRPGRRGVGA